MEFETPEAVRSTPSRHEKSLGLLTMKFVSLLQEAKDGVLDLKVVSETGRVTRLRVVVSGMFWGELVGVLQCHWGTKGCQSQRGQSGALICLTGGLASRH